MKRVIVSTMAASLLVSSVAFGAVSDDEIEELRDVARRCAAAGTAEELDLAGAPYPDEVMRAAMDRSLLERGL